MHNYEIAEYFSLLAKLMDIHGENPFKTKSYANAAFTLDKLTEPVTEMEPAQLYSIRGIGEAIGKKIIGILQTGQLDLLDEYIQKTPPGILEMIKIKGLGPKKITTIWKELEIETVGELLYACHENRLVNYKGFGAKTQQNIQDALEFYLQHQGSYLYQELEPIVASLTIALTQAFPKEEHTITGGYLRQIESLDFLEVLTTLSLATVKTWLEEKGFVCEPMDNYLSSKGTDNFEIRWFTSSKEHFQSTAFQLSCTPEFWLGIEALASFKAINFSTTPFLNEAAIFEQLGIGFVPAPQREFASILNNVANKKALPKPIQINDIRGIIHSHSTWSDGIHTIEQMALAAIEKGYEYLVISDHSKSAFYANGLQVDRIKAQHKEIDALNKKLAPFVIFKSIESDILNDGSLDYPDEVLDSFDLVIASVHSNLKMTEEKAMMRLLNAINNPYTSILGHPTGRLLLSRKGYPVDHEKLIEACAANNVVMELNAHPRRLDIDWRYIHQAIEQDVLISIDPDAHEIDGFEDCKYGVLVAQKAGLRAAQNLSSFSLSEMMEFIAFQQEKRNN
jgi:DNA polymerase (family 10)